MGRPDTFVGVLNNIAAWLDASDKYIGTFGPAKERGFPRGHEVQDDLRRLAARMESEPELDARLMAMMDDE